MKKPNKKPEILTALQADANSAIDNAIKRYSNAIMIDDTDWEAHRGLGVAYILNAKKFTGEENLKAELEEKGVAQWRRSLDINPTQSRHEKLRRLIEQYSKQPEIQ